MGLFSKAKDVYFNKSKDLLFGKKDKGTPDQYVDTRTKYDIKRDRLAREAESDMIQRMRGMANEVDSPEARESFRKNLLFQQRQEENQLLGAGRDAQMKARDMIARRGLGNSAVGLRAELKADEPYRRGLASARTRLISQLPELERERRMRTLNQIIGGVKMAGSGRSSQVDYVQGREATGRGGGLFDVAATAAGAYLGGPAGAQAGKGAAGALRGAM